MECVYIITLNPDKEHVKNMKSILNFNGISNVKIIEGAHGIKMLQYGNKYEETLSKSKRCYYTYKMNEILREKNIIDKKIDDLMSFGQIGYYFSMLKVFNDATNNNYKYFLVLEDDVFFDRNFKQFLINALRELKYFDVLYLGVSPYYEKPLGGKSIAVSNNVRKLTGTTLSGEYMGGIPGTFAVLYNLRAISIIKENLFPIKYPYDVLLGRLINIENKLEGYGTKGNIIYVKLDKKSTTKF